MDLPQDFTTFFSTLIITGTECKIKIQDVVGCFITNIALDQEDLPAEGKVFVNVSVNGSETVTVVPFTIGKFESTFTDLRFCSNDSVVFSLKGAKVKVHLCGYLTNGMSVDVDNGYEEKPLVPVPEEENKKN